LVSQIWTMVVLCFPFVQDGASNRQAPGPHDVGSRYDGQESGLDRLSCMGEDCWISGLSPVARTRQGNCILATASAGQIPNCRNCREYWIRLNETGDTTLCHTNQKGQRETLNFPNSSQKVKHRSKTTKLPNSNLSPLAQHTKTGAFSAPPSSLPPASNMWS
jgi:hypothetical protein